MVLTLEIISELFIFLIRNAKTSRLFEKKIAVKSSAAERKNMNTDEKANLYSETSPKLTARLIGVLSLLTILGGIFAQGFITGKLVNLNDAAATATNILNNESLFRLGFVVFLFEMTCQIFMTALFYRLLKPVNKSLALLALVIGLAGCIIKTFSRVFFLSPLLVLGNESYLKGFTAEQLQSLALVFLKINDLGPTIALYFFGLESIIRGYLILRSTFLPRFLGVIGMIAGFGWLSFIHPPLGYKLFPFIALIALIAAIVEIFWLIVYGVNEQRWLEQAKAAKHSV